MHLYSRTLIILCISASASLLAQSAPQAPADLKIDSSMDSSVTLSWSASPGALSYKIYYSTAPGVTPANATKAISGISPTSDTISGLTNNTAYYFIVTALNAGGESAPSVQQTATPIANPAQPQAPDDGGPTKSGPGNGAAATSASKPTTNVGSASGTNVQNPSLTFSVLPSTVPAVSVTAGTVTYDPNAVETLISEACQSSSPSFASVVGDGSTYTLINVINLAGANGSQTVKSNNWYAYSKGKTWASGFVGGWHLSDFDGATRLYGANRIFLLSMVLNDLTPGTPAVRYTVTVTKATATNVSNVYQLLGIVFPAAGAPNAGLQASATPNWWACSLVPVAYKTSGIKTDTSYTSGGGSPFTASQTFTNEAKQRWDVSFALPIKKASALQFNSTANTVTASQINKQNLFAVIDFYPIPVNLSATSTSFWPSVFGGVAMDSQPLHSLLFGASIGVHVAQVYAGALLIKGQQLNGLSTGSTASPSQLASATRYAFNASFSVGIKISISSAASALSGGKNK